MRLPKVLPAAFVRSMSSAASADPGEDVQRDLADRTAGLRQPIRHFSGEAQLAHAGIAWGEILPDRFEAVVPRQSAVGNTCRLAWARAEPWRVGRGRWCSAARGELAAAVPSIWLTPGSYDASQDHEEPHAIMLRSHGLKDEEVGPTVRCVARCGAGTNNVPVAHVRARWVFNSPARTRTL